MKRILTLDPATAAELFMVLYAAFAGGINPSTARGIEVLRPESALLKALHGISDATDDRDASGRKVRRWREGATTLLPQHAQIEMLRHRIETVVWLPEKAADIVYAYDWLGTGVEVKDAEP